MSDQKCYSPIRGRAMRATRLDRCGRPETGANVAIETDAFVEITMTARVTEGEEITVTKANGKKCVSDKGVSTFDGWTVNIQFCGVNPYLFEMTTGMPVVLDAEGVAVGFKVKDNVNLDANAVALEVWSDIPGDTCTVEGAEGTWGYSLLPYLKGGVLADRTINNGAIDFTVQNMETKPGSGWGAGPYDVTLQADGNPGPLLENQEIGPNDHELLMLVNVAPPADGGCVTIASGPAATGATAGSPATITPADSYPPETLTELQAGSVVASPLTAWTTGQYLVLGDDSEAHWDGDSWVAGRAV
jgi:hypothetical protein